jgi:hypothetical protein
MRVFAYLPTAALGGGKEGRPMESHTVVVPVLGAAMFIIAFVGLMVKLIQLGQK